MLRFKTFLLENRINWLKKNVKDIDTSHDSLADKHEPHEIIDHFAQHDPTRKKVYTQWMVNQYKKQNIRQEDAPRLGETLSDFEEHKHKLDNRDINQYHHPSDLEDAVRPHVEREAEENPLKHPDHQRHLDSGSVEKIHSGKNIDVYKMKSGEAASHYAKGTSWCTSSPHTADRYINQDPLYLLHGKKDGRRYQMHFPTKQFANERDVMKPLHELAEKYPEMRKVDEFKSKGGEYAYALASTDEEARQVIRSDGRALAGMRGIPARHFNEFQDHRDDNVSAKFYHNTEALKRMEPHHVDKALDAYEREDKSRPIENAAIRNSLMSNSLPLKSHHVDRLLDSGGDKLDDMIARAISKRDDLSSHHVDKLISNGGDGQVMAELADKPSVSSHQLHKILDHPNTDLQGYHIAAHRSDLDPSHVDKIIEKARGDHFVLKNLSDNHAAPLQDHHVEEIMREHQQGVLSADDRRNRIESLSRRRDISDKQMSRLTSDEFRGFHHNVARSPSLKPHHIDQLMRDRDLHVSLTHNPKLSNEHVSKLFNSILDRGHPYPGISDLVETHHDKLSHDQVHRVLSLGTGEGGKNVFQDDMGTHVTNAQQHLLRKSDKLKDEHVDKAIEGGSILALSSLAANENLRQDHYSLLINKKPKDDLKRSSVMLRLALNPAVKGENLDRLARDEYAQEHVASRKDIEDHHINHISKTSNVRAHWSLINENPERLRDEHYHNMIDSVKRRDYLHQISLSNAIDSSPHASEAVKERSRRELET